VRSAPLPQKIRENPMNLTRLAFTQHPRPPQRELRQRGVFDSGGRLIGQVVNIYVDDDRNFRFVDVAMSGLMSFGKKHHLVPVEAIAEEESGSITLRVDQQSVESAPTLGSPHAAPDEGLQRAAREHCGLAAVPSEP
jgi:hypothetical protein